MKTDMLSLQMRGDNGQNNHSPFYKKSFHDAKSFLFILLFY